MLHNLIRERAQNLGIGDSYHTFESKQEYVNLERFETPSKSYQRKWLKCIEFSKSEIFDEFLSQTENQEVAEGMTHVERIDVANSILSSITKSLNNSEDYCDFQFFRTPLFEMEERDKSILVPFPRLLVSTTQFRIEELFQQFDNLVQEEDDRKGGLVENLVIDALKQFDCRNLIRSFKYTDPHPRETDGLLLFEDSFWSVEVKSHPIFRKLPTDIDTAVHRFEKKTLEGISQGKNTIDFLKSEEDNVLYHLTGEKSLQDKDWGTIVVLDGLLPTLLSQNRRADEMFGLSRIYEQVENEERVYIITIFDLFEMANLSEETGDLEGFLQWRTNYRMNMPVFSFNERDYWAMYFDIVRDNPEFQSMLDKAADDESMLAYISERFNSNPHIPENGFEE